MKREMDYFCDWLKGKNGVCSVTTPARVAGRNMALLSFLPSGRRSNKSKLAMEYAMRRRIENVLATSGATIKTRRSE